MMWGPWSSGPGQGGWGFTGMRKHKVRRWLVALAVSVLTIGGFAALQSSPASASTNWPPDAWQYCYNTVPAGQTTSISYAGIYGRPYQNSVGTTCRDRVQNSWFYWYS